MGQHAQSPDRPGAARFRVALERRIEIGELDLPLLPKVASRVVALAGDERADAAALARLIRGDQALAGQVMRIANSPAYRPRETLVSLQQAIARLGMGTVAEIAFAVSVRGEVFDVAGYEAQVAYLWRHALGSGAWAREIARMLRRNVESTFLCGLLHQIGKPVVLRLATDVAKTEGLAAPDPDEAAELMRDYHTTVGTTLGETWKLPDAVVSSIGFCECYDAAPRFRDEAMMTRLAGALATHLLDPEMLDEQAIAALPVVPDLNIYPEDLAALLDKRAAMLETIEDSPA